MPCILSIETSTVACSVAVSYDGNVIYSREETTGPSHASLLGTFVENALGYVRKNELNLNAVAVSCGPGSYTGLRIGVSEAKGLCFGLDIPLIAINTLLLMASKVSKSYPVDKNVLLCPMIDARRMEVYAGIFSHDLKTVRDIQADIVDENTYSAFMDKQQVVFFGNGAAKCKDQINSKHAVFLDNIYPLAADMVSLAENAFSKNEFVDVAYFEPFYLKEFVATVPKNKLIG